jgi:hypothetical protein
MDPLDILAVAAPARFMSKLKKISQSLISGNKSIRNYSKRTRKVSLLKAPLRFIEYCRNILNVDDKDSL